MPREIKFCLDANISPRAAKNRDNVIHVKDVRDLSTTKSGHSDATDLEIAKWCANEQYVLVTCDKGFRARKQYLQAMHKVNFEVIVVTYKLGSQNNHVDLISKKSRLWTEELEALPFDARVWVQSRHKPLRQDRSRNEVRHGRN